MRRRLFLLSSSLSTSFHWRKLLPEFSEAGCLVVLADPPGFGESELSGMSMPLSTRAKVLWGVLDDVDARFASGLSTWHLIGHGASCPTVLEMANLYPDSVRSQVHVSPCLPVDDRGRLFKSGRRAMVRLLEKNLCDARSFAQFIARAAGKPLPDYVWEPMWRPYTRPRARNGLTDFLLAENPVHAMRDFCPSMAIWGGRDPLMPSLERESVLRLLPDVETHVIRAAGHFPMETHSRALRDFMRGWIKYVEE